MFVVSNNKHLQVSVITNGVCEIENLCGRQSRQAMRTNRCIWWLSEAEATDLTFCYFLVKQKVEEEIFNQPTKIEEGDASATLSSRIELFYGVNQQRNKAIRYFNNSVENTHYYFGKYFEKEIAGTTDTARRYDYIYGDNGVVALHTTTILPSTDTTGGGGDPRVVADGTYYIHTDHLGSYCALTDLNKKVVQRNYFDPWGNFKWVYKGRGDEFVMTDSLQRDTISMQPIATANFTVSSRGFTGHEHYPQFKIINMNGRLYDPVICRFFSPDKYVMNSSFTQDFNRYSYARNNPLKYNDPTGDSFWDVISSVLFFPARILSEAFGWANDKMNGIDRPNGYFNSGYLLGQTEPGASFKVNPANLLPYYHPNYISPSAGISTIALGTGWTIGADNEWNDYIFHKFNEQEYVRKVGSKRLMWLSGRAAASGGIDLKGFAKLLIGTYVGKFEGVNVYESKTLGEGLNTGGLTLPGRGIIVGEGTFTQKGHLNVVKALMQHEFGHIIQSGKVGYKAFYQVIAPESLASATLYQVTNSAWNHNTFWTETWANYLSKDYFGSNWLGGLYPSEYPVQNISTFNWIRLLMVR